MIKQTGLLFKIDTTDFITGSSPLVAPDVNPSADWTNHLPEEEKQFLDFTFDTMSCTTFSALNIIETWVNWHIANDSFTVLQLQKMSKLGFFKNGKFNICDRFTAIMSGTKRNGNFFQKVLDSVRHDGLLPEIDLPFGGKNWDEYHNPKVITQEMKLKAKKILDLIEVSYEWNTLLPNDIDNLIKGLKKCPIQAGIPNPATHAVQIVSEHNRFDTYPPFIIKNGDIAYQMRIFVKVKKPAVVWKYFKLTEKTGSLGHTIADLKPELVNLMDKMRGECGFPWIITSGYRTVKENNALPNSATDSAHTTREAVDILCTDNIRRQILIDVARRNGINRIGVGKNFIHLDISKTLPQNVTWTY